MFQIPKSIHISEKLFDICVNCKLVKWIAAFLQDRKIHFHTPPLFSGRGWPRRNFTKILMGALKMQDKTLQDRKMTDKLAWPDFAGQDNDGQEKHHAWVEITRRMAVANWTCVSWVAYAPGTIAVNVTWVEREFNACQTPRSMYTSIFNRLHAIARYWSEIATFSYPPLDLTPP